MFENYNISSIMVTHTLLDIGLPFSLLLMRVGFGLGFSCHSVCITNIFVSYQIITSRYKGGFSYKETSTKNLFCPLNRGKEQFIGVCVWGRGEGWREHSLLVGGGGGSYNLQSFCILKHKDRFLLL